MVGFAEARVQFYAVAQMFFRKQKVVFLQCDPGEQMPCRNVVRIELDHALVGAARQPEVACAMQCLALVELLGNQSGINGIHTTKSTMRLLRADAISAARLPAQSRGRRAQSRGLFHAADITLFSVASSPGPSSAWRGRRSVRRPGR